MTSFYLKKNISQLKNIMLLPPKTLKVVIVDDSSDEIKAMEYVLQHWPKIKLTTCIHVNGEKLHIPLDADIVLLDYYLDGVTGDVVVSMLKEKRFGGIVSSISTSLHPVWAHFHFPYKKEIAASEFYASGFVHYMNELIRRFEDLKKWK